MPVNNITITILYYIYQVLRIYYWILIASIFLSWLPELRHTMIGRWITRLSDPYMRIFRGLIVVGMFDFTPIIGFVLYNIGLNYFAQMINIMASS